MSVKNPEEARQSLLELGTSDGGTVEGVPLLSEGLNTEVTEDTLEGVLYKQQILILD